ncbi:uncharacterized protein LOC123558074 [Mercenaria mercenaria]|uniref:uncharacterized protein LOC123558074 n=1 Tax=Mercenaria mercenaria TaxID=6596 RepID=UPI00234E9746|nr:uncharacterized protein LOC123558074 [Mercenaria mercenaria]
MEQRLLDNCDKIKQENSNAIQKMSKYFEDLKKELDVIHGQITSKEEESTYKFVKARKASSALKSLESQIYATDGRSRLKVCQLNRNQFYNVILSKGNPLGEIEVTTQRQGNVQNEISIPKRERFINVKSSSDRMGCNISGIAALSDTTIACTDWNNHKIKLIDVTDGTLSSEIDVEPDPWDLTLVPNKEIAVTLNSAQKIQFLSFKQSLCKSRFIKVNGKCRGITYSKDRLVVSYDKDPKVEILNLRGKVLKCFKTDYTGKALFIYPLYVAVSSVDDIIYVSDQAANSVFKLTFDGQVLTTYKDPDLLNPRKIIVCENDYMLVCNFSKSTVQLVSPGNKKLMNILDRVDVLGYCMALHYDEEHAKLYLSNYESRFQIQMFKLT